MAIEAQAAPAVALEINAVIANLEANKPLGKLESLGAFDPYWQLKNVSHCNIFWCPENTEQ
jgi:hypothetical protein